MIKLLLVFIAPLLAYLLGSIPTAVWAGKWFFNLDVREHGSGNAGATNAFRVLGARVALAVLLIDALKGALAVSLAGWLGIPFEGTTGIIYRFLLGAMALLGHVFPVFAGFRGGKGIATLTGMVAVLFPWVMLICLVVFLLAFLPTRYVSLGSLSAGLCFALTITFFRSGSLWPEIAFAWIVAVFVVLTHTPNISRLLKGTENKIRFRSH